MRVYGIAVGILVWSLENKMTVGLTQALADTANSNPGKAKSLLTSTLSFRLL